MRGPELHTLLVIRPAPLSPSVDRLPAAGSRGEGQAVDPPSHDDVAPRSEPPREGVVSSRRQFASGGYQVHNGRPAAPVILG